MSERLFHTDLFGIVRLIHRDITGRVLIEATQHVRNRPEWPQTIAPGYREWVGPYAIGKEASPLSRPHGGGK